MRRRIVQVGVAPSGIGLDWLRAIAQASDWTLAGIVDTQPDHLQSAARRLGLSPDLCFTTIGAAASTLDFDACVLVVPSPLHGALCGQALDARKHVIVEKPFTVDFGEAQALAVRAEQAGLCLVVNQNYRYMTELGTLRHAIHDGVAGAPSFMGVTFDCLWPGRPYQWSMSNTMLLEMAVHHFDAIVTCSRPSRGPYRARPGGRPGRAITAIQSCPAGSTSTTAHTLPIRGVSSRRGDARPGRASGVSSVQRVRSILQTWVPVMVSTAAASPT